MKIKENFSRIIIAFLIGGSQLLNAQTLISHDFNDGNFGPYEVNKRDQESRVKIRNNSVETHWQEDLYNGTNSGRKAQIRLINDIIFKQHIWMGLKLKIGSDYMRENTNTNAGLMQIWGNNGSGSANHMCMLKFDGRNGGALVWQHRYNSVANKTHYLVEPNFPRNEFVNVIVHVQLKTRNTGIVQVWVNGDLKIDKRNQTIGWGDMDENGMTNGTYAFGTSIGQYNYFANAGRDDAYDGDDHLFDGHLDGETRTVTYDNVSLYNGVDGYDNVNPATDAPAVIPVHIRKRNASNFAIDGGNGGENRQNIKLFSSDKENENQQWIEIDRGSGFYSYKKIGTNFCIDGNGGGENGQNVYLWTCDAGNQNQHWKKENVSGTNAFKLIKRNAPNFALNGGPGGARDQNIDLGPTNSTSQDLHWFIDPINTLSTDTIEDELQRITIYPNPVKDVLNIKFKGEEAATVSILNLTGQKVYSGTIKKGNNKIDIEALSKGMYIIKIVNGEDALVQKIIRK